MPRPLYPSRHRRRKRRTSLVVEERTNDMLALWTARSLLVTGGYRRIRESFHTEAMLNAIGFTARWPR